MIDGPPARAPLLPKLKIWSDANWDTKGPGLNWKSSDPAVPLMEALLTVTAYVIGAAEATEKRHIVTALNSKNSNER
jgi:hypothetical protein